MTLRLFVGGSRHGKMTESYGDRTIVQVMKPIEISELRWQDYDVPITPLRHELEKYFRRSIAYLACELRIYNVFVRARPTIPVQQIIDIYAPFDLQEPELMRQYIRAVVDATTPRLLRTVRGR